MRLHSVSRCNTNHTLPGRRGGGAHRGEGETRGEETELSHSQGTPPRFVIVWQPCVSIIPGNTVLMEVFIASCNKAEYVVTWQH